MKNDQNTILITGGASGIGRAITEAVLSEGWNAVVVDLNTKDLSLCKKELDQSSGSLLCEELDVSDEIAVSTFVKNADKTYHPFTGVVNSAGIGKDILALDTDIAFFRRILEVNLIGSFIVNREVAKLMIPRKKGAIGVRCRNSGLCFVAIPLWLTLFHSTMLSLPAKINASSFH